MSDYLFLMHAMPRAAGEREGDWQAYLGWLRGTGQFAGGSAIGGGVCVSKSGVPAEISAQLAGYIRVTASSIEDARRLLSGNPVFEAGGIVEIRELPTGNG